MVIDERLVKVVSWYDNEWGYSNRRGGPRGASARGGAGCLRRTGLGKRTVRDLEVGRG